MKHKLFIASLVLFSLPIGAKADEAGPLVISQIQVSGPAGADDEFIEIKNISADPVSLIGWSAQYKSATGSFPVSAKRNLPDVVVPAGKYFLIATATYSGSVVADLTHSSFSMSGATAGASVFISKSTSPVTSFEDVNISDHLTYGTGGAPLPPSGKVIMRVGYSNDLLTDFILADPMPRNLSYVEPLPENPEPQDPEHENPETPIPEDPIEESPPVEEPAPEDPPAEQEPNQPSAPTYSSDIIITEIFPNPKGADSGKEWVELKNNSHAAVDLEGWILDDEGTSEPASNAYTITNTVIGSGEYKAIIIPEKKFTLNNGNKDAVRLFWPDKTLVSRVPYEGPVHDDQSWCLLQSTYSSCIPTPGQINSALEVEEGEDQIDEIDYENYSVRIIGILPNPVGADSGNELVILVNEGDSQVNLKDWLLDDGFETEPLGSTAYSLDDTLLDPGEDLEIVIPKGRFSLSNTGSDGLRLYSPDRKLHDHVLYQDADKSKEGFMYSKANTQWQWMIDVGGIAGVNLLETSANLKDAKKLPKTGISFDKFLSGLGLSGILFMV